MPEKYTEAIIKFLSGRQYQPLKPRQLARQLGVEDEEYGAFRSAIKALRDAGRIVLGSKDALTLPDIGSQVVGTFRANQRGFGFVIPDTPNSHGDLFVPEEATSNALTGDRVRAKVFDRGKRDGEQVYSGQIVEILQRGQNRVVGTLEKADRAWFVMPEGKQMLPPIVVRDVGPQHKQGMKVVTEIVDFGSPGTLPTGVITEAIGLSGEPEVETQAVILAHDIPYHWPEDVLEEARHAVHSFDASDPAVRSGRDDLTEMTIVTIDPDDARDFDDAISIKPAGKGQVELGIHIADVSHFVPEGGPLDVEAKRRGNSVYFPRRVVPMLPEVLSNGVCSLQEGVPRLCKSAFVTYDADGNVVARRFAETIIQSAKRLTYTQAQDAIDAKASDLSDEIVQLLQRMDTLARAIRERRRKQGMLSLDLPEVELEFDEDGRVIDAHPGDDAFTHTIIEMFMVEANEAVAGAMVNLERACLRRIHPEPDNTSGNQLSSFVQACGHRLSRDLRREDLQKLLASVKGRPESYAVNLAVLKTFNQAEYSPMLIGHFALASSHYAHFTSPIRRYPDLTVHRMLAAHLRGELEDRPPEDMGELVKLGEHCTATERRAESAERELRDVLVLQLLETKIGEHFDGVITGVTNFGIFVQLERFGIEGLVRIDALGDDWWDVEAKLGQVRGERTGKVFRIGDRQRVIISGVDQAKRQLNLSLERRTKGPAKTPKGSKKSKGGKSGKKKGKTKKSGKTSKGGKSGKSGNGRKGGKGRRRSKK